MNINRSNYESFVIDYLDGKLDAIGVSELLLFIEQHPDIKSEVELLEGIRAEDTVTTQFDGSFLRKPTYEQVKPVYEEKLVASLEGDLTYNEEEELRKACIIYPELQRDADLFSKTRFTPDTAIVFDAKKELRKPVPIQSTYFGYGWKVAAAVLFIGGLFMILSRADMKEEVRMPLAVIPTPALKTYAEAEKKMPVPAQPVKAHHTRLIKGNASLQSGRPSKSVNINFVKVETVLPAPTISIDAPLPQLVYTLPKVRMTSDATQIEIKSGEEFKALPELAGERLKAAVNDVLIERNKPASASRKLSLSDLGLLFVKLYNSSTGDEAKVIRNYDSTGNVVGYGIIANNFQFSTGK